MRIGVLDGTLLVYGNNNVNAFTCKKIITITVLVKKACLQILSKTCYEAGS